MSEIQSLLVEFNRNLGVSAAAISACETDLGLKLPNEYVEFLKLSDGGEGFIGENYIILWSCDELPQLNRSYKVEQFLPGFLIFGSDGGGEAYGYDTRTDSLKIVQVPFVVMNWDDARPMGTSFNAFLERIFHSD
jgi:hypothetical protein